MSVKQENQTLITGAVDMVACDLNVNSLYWVLSMGISLNLRVASTSFLLLSTEEPRQSVLLSGEGYSNHRIQESQGRAF